MAQKENQIGENGGERKKNPSANPANLAMLIGQLFLVLEVSPFYISIAHKSSHADWTVIPGP